MKLPTERNNEKQPVHPRSCKTERVFVNLEAVYPDPNNPKHEMSLEELRAKNRGWMDKEWVAHRRAALKEKSNNMPAKEPSVNAIKKKGDQEDPVNKGLSGELNEKLAVDDPVGDSDATDQKPGKVKKIKVREVKGETQTSKNFTS